MPGIDGAADVALLAEAARGAGEIARRHFAGSPRIWDKDDGAGPVTEADLEVDRFLSETLRAARPDLGWLSEESEDDRARLTTAAQFICDPIDGTRAFIDGGKDWGHSLAIVRDGTVTAAAVYLPMRDRLYAAGRGLGATCNGAPIAVTRTAALDRGHVLAVRPALHPGHWKGGKPPPVTRHFRSSLAYRLCLVAEGRFDAMLTLRKAWEWDIAAGALIVEEAGGHATDRQGRALRFNNADPRLDGTVAGGALHRPLVDRLA